MGPRFKGQSIAGRKFLRRERTIASMRNLGLDMEPAHDIVICSVEVRDFGKPRSWILCQWMKCNAISPDKDELRVCKSTACTHCYRGIAYANDQTGSDGKECRP